MKTISYLVLLFSVFFLNSYYVNGYVISSSDEHKLLLKADEIELYKSESDDDSWLKMVLVFSKEESANRTVQVATNNTNGNTTTDCLADFVRLGEHCYYFSNTRANWYNATRICHLLESDLAHPLNQTENSFVENYLKQHYHGWWWFGGTDEATEGEWLWSYSQVHINFTNWYTHMPDNDKGVEDCLSYWENYGWKWNDGNCLLSYNFICQQY
ncbi:hypothetical protein CHUAL_007253 [Chamberlinius hualienensis]